MSPAKGIFLLMNNYFHDVATALLVASGFVMWLIIRRYEEAKNLGVTAYLLRIHTVMRRIAWFAAGWIIIGGIPRIVTCRQFEWANAVEKNLKTPLIVKYILALALIIAGLYLWIKLEGKIKIIQREKEIPE